MIILGVQGKGFSHIQYKNIYYQYLYVLLNLLLFIIEKPWIMIQTGNLSERKGTCII